jgi:alanine dehydrogenase
MVRLLSDDDVASVLSLPALLAVVADAFRAQAAGDVERPDRPHFPMGFAPGDAADPAGTGLVMPAYVHGADHCATKLVGVHEGNADRGLPTVNAQVALTDAGTGLPAAYLDGTRVTNARTGCVGGLAARELADAPVTLGLLGAGTQARWQARAVAAATDLAAVRVHSPSDSRERCAADLRAELDADVEAADSPRDAVAGAKVVITATTATEPTFPAAALADDAVVVAVGAYTAEMQELSPAVFERASALYADTPDEVAAIGDALAAGLDADDFHPYADLLDGDRPDGIVVVESVGTAVLDAAAAEHLFERAVEEGVGTEFALSAAEDRATGDGSAP